MHASSWAVTRTLGYNVLEDFRVLVWSQPGSSASRVYTFGDQSTGLLHACLVISYDRSITSPCLSATLMSVNSSLVNPSHCFVFNILCDWMRPSRKVIVWKAVYFVAVLSPPTLFKNTLEF